MSQQQQQKHSLSHVSICCMYNMLKTCAVYSIYIKDHCIQQCMGEDLVAPAELMVPVPHIIPEFLIFKTLKWFSPL